VTIVTDTKVHSDNRNWTCSTTHSRTVFKRHSDNRKWT